MVPQPGLRIDGFTHGAQDLERWEVVLVGELFPELHESSDGGRGRVELAHLVLLDNFPEPVVGRVEGSTLEDDGGGSVQKGAVGYVGMTGDPA